ATPGNPVPEPPYICFLVDGSANVMADNKVYHKINDVNIELYTTKKDLVAEAKLEKVLIYCIVNGLKSVYFPI
ncbi:hypothetical protein FOA24_21870, partial [Bacillus thuringiensis]